MLNLTMPISAWN